MPFSKSKTLTANTVGCCKKNASLRFFDCDFVDVSDLRIKRCGELKMISDMMKGIDDRTLAVVFGKSISQCVDKYNRRLFVDNDTKLFYEHFIVGSIGGEIDDYGYSIDVSIVGEHDFRNSIWKTTRCLCMYTTIA